jgi:hypothetical protein
MGKDWKEFSLWTRRTKMRKGLVAMIILALVAVLAAGCESVSLPTPAPEQEHAPTPMPAPTVKTVEKENFRLLISDEVNAIEDFEHLYVTISSIGVHQSGEAGGWREFDPLDDPDGDNITGIDLRPLEGENALAIWSGNLTDGEYTKVFINVENVTGILADGGGTADVKLSSNKLQISKPFTIGDSVVNFVYDITVVEAGKSDKYILKPQIAQSGANQKFREMKQERETVKIGEDDDEELELEIEGEPGLGMEVTLIVTDNGSAVVGANVTVSDEEAGITDADGRLPIVLPDTPGEVEIEATLGDKEGELEIELEEEEQAEEFEGTIIEISEGEENASPWVMTLEGVAGQVTVYVTELEGTPAVGAKAEVEGVLKDNTIEDAKAEVEEEE